MQIAEHFSAHASYDSAPSGPAHAHPAPPRPVVLHLAPRMGIHGMECFPWRSWWGRRGAGAAIRRLDPHAQPVLNLIELNLSLAA